MCSMCTVVSRPTVVYPGGMPPTVVYLRDGTPLTVVNLRDGTPLTVVHLGVSSLFPLLMPEWVILTVADAGMGYSHRCVHQGVPHRCVPQGVILLYPVWFSVDKTVRC